MKVCFALAILAFALSANASSIRCGPSRTDCKEPKPAELCQKTCKNVCHDVVSYITDFKLENKCLKECVKKTRQVPCTIQKEKCEDVCVTKYKTVTKYRYVDFLLVFLNLNSFSKIKVTMSQCEKLRTFLSLRF